MKVKTTKMIPLLYGNNVHQESVCEIDSTLFAQQSEADLQEALLRTYRTHGYSGADDPEKLYLHKADGEIRPLPLAGMPQEGDAIVYQSAIAPSNAYEYARENGIVYFFHTTEQGHRDYPHIHAKHGDEEISVYFSDFHIVGTMKPPIRKKALRYIKGNVEKLTKEWNRIQTG